MDERKRVDQCDEASFSQVTNRSNRKKPGEGRERGEGQKRRRRKKPNRGNSLRTAFDEDHESRRERRGYSRLGDPSQLVFLDTSPNFCNRNKFGAGTRGRTCERGEGCRHLCCGRGYDTSVVQVTKPCRCRVEWCCEVVCHNCTRREERYTCK